MFTTEQESAIQTIRQGRNVLLTGPAGCGKSYVIEHFYRIYVQRCGEDAKRFIVKTSLTGISASIIGGVTLHSFLGIGLGTETVEQLQRKIENIRVLKNRYVTIRVLIIDEISMLSAELFDKINLLFQLIRKKPHLPFGGVQVILSGDFCQLPVIGRNIKFCFQSEQWNTVIHSTFYLQHVHRQTNQLFIRILLKIRLGKIDDEVIQVLTDRIGKDVSVGEIKPTKLYSTRQLVNDNNLEELQKLNSNIRTFSSRYQYFTSPTNSSIPPSKVTNLTDKQTLFLKDLINKSTIAEEELQLCQGCQVMILMNKFVDGSPIYVNGSRGVVLQFTPEGYPVVKLLNGQLHTFEFHNWSMTYNEHIVIKHQIPLKLAWSITIHKAQGLSLDCVETDIGDSLFENGQAYVALSRVRTLEGLSLVSFNPTKIKVHPDVITYYEQLLLLKNQTSSHPEVYTIPLSREITPSATIVKSVTNDVYTIPMNSEMNKSIIRTTNATVNNDVYTIPMKVERKQNTKTVKQENNEYTISIKQKKLTNVATTEQQEKVIPLSEKQIKQIIAKENELNNVETPEEVEVQKPTRRRKAKNIIMIQKSEL